MRKAINILLLVLAIVIVVSGTLYFLVMTGLASIVPDARTLYEGYVEIEPILLVEIKAKLEAQGCHTDYNAERSNPCMYKERQVSQLREKGIEIYPHGPGFGPLSFFVTENKLWAEKDIPGSPNPEKFKEEVRQDVKSINNIVKIKENSWKITKMEYPWTVLY